MDNESLRQQRLDKPAGLEQRRIVPAVESVKHCEESGIIENGADRAYEDHEFEDVADVPFPRNRKILLINIIGWNRSLREIVKQIVRQHLDRQHWQERQEGACAEHAEHVAEVRACPHFDVLCDVAENLAA